MSDSPACIPPDVSHGRRPDLRSTPSRSGDGMAGPASLDDDLDDGAEAPPLREGLPLSCRMRAEPHYVDALTRPQSRASVDAAIGAIGAIAAAVGAVCAALRDLPTRGRPLPERMAVELARALCAGHADPSRLTVRVAPRHGVSACTIEVAQNAVRLPASAYMRFFDAEWIDHPAGRTGVVLLAAARRMARLQGGGLDRKVDAGGGVVRNAWRAYRSGLAPAARRVAGAHRGARPAAGTR